MNYIFDGSYEGYLCCVFEAFERKEFHAVPVTQSKFTVHMFTESREIQTDSNKSDRIIQGLHKAIGKKVSMQFYHNFLADNEQAWANGFQLMIKLFQGKIANMRDFGNPEILLLQQSIKKVHRERHRVKAFVRFVKSNNELYTAVIEPDFNVLPLVSTFFKNRFADQQWLIYDIKRDYGIHYDLNTVHEVRNELEEEPVNPYEITVDLDPREKEFQHLWKTYFKHTNIEARKNMKLHLRHVPKRYWHYLVEKLD